MNTYDVLRILTVSLLDKTELVKLFKQAKTIENYQNGTQLKLYSFLEPLVVYNIITRTY